MGILSGIKTLKFDPYEKSDFGSLATGWDADGACPEKGKIVQWKRPDGMDRVWHRKVVCRQQWLVGIGKWA
jgi:hypothetical protein